MGRAIVVGTVIVVVLLILAGVWIWTRRHDFKGDLSVGEEKHMRDLVSQAAIIFMSLGPQLGVDESDFLSRKSTQAIKGWLDEYQKNRKEFERA